MLHNPSQHPATPDIQHELDAETYATTLTALGWQFEALGMEEVIGQLPQDSWADMPTDEGEELPPMDAARLIAAELAAQLCLEPGCDQLRTVDSRFCSRHTTERAIEQFTAPIQREIATPCEPMRQPHAVADRDSMLASFILDRDDDSQIFTTLECAAYLHRRTGWSLSRLTVETILYRLREQGFYFTDGRQWARSAKPRE